MATLTITANEDYRDGTPPLNLNTDHILFSTAGAVTAIFKSTQFGVKAAIANNVAIAGDDFDNNLSIVLSANTFSAAGWTFSNWTAGIDNVLITGTTGNDTITGSSQNDRITGDDGTDTLNGGGGDDTFIVENHGLLDGAESYNGGSGSDTLALISNLGNYLDFTSATFSSVERLTFSGAGCAVMIDGAAFGADGFNTVVGGGGEDRLDFENVKNIDLSIVSLSSWSSNDTIFLFGTAGADIMTATSQVDHIVGRGGADVLNAGGGNDDFRYSNAADLAAGESLNGGGGFDQILLFGEGSYDFSVAAVTSVEELEFSLFSSFSSTTVTFSGAQIGNGPIRSVIGDSGSQHLIVNAASDVNLSEVSFTDWINGPDTVTINGTASGESLTGSDQNDTIDGNAGNDTINGGAGFDDAVFAGPRASYTVTRNGVTVTVNGRDGTDTLTGVERLQFDNGPMSLRTENDFNGDGKSDVLFSSPGAVYASNYEWQLNNRSLISQGAVDLYDKAFTVQVVGDFDGDFKSDVLFQNPTTGGVWEWRLDGRTILSQGAVDVGDPSFHLLGTGDFNVDGRDDVLFRNGAGFVYEWQMNGRVNTPQAVGPLDPNWHVQGTGDFNGDGKDDILLHYKDAANAADPANGAFVVWQMNGAAIEQTLGIERPDRSWQTLGIGDFNGDGIDDLAIRNVSNTADNGAVWVYLLAGTVTSHGDGSKTLDILAQSAAGIADPATWKLQQIGDLDGDGKDDILYRNDAGTFYSWDMNGTHIGSEGLLQGAAQHADPSFTVVKPHWDLV